MDAPASTDVSPAKPAATGAPRPEAPKAAEPARSSADTIAIKALLPNRAVRLRIDEATRIIQAVVVDADTGKVLRKYPDDDILKLDAALLEFARQAFVDKSV